MTATAASFGVLIPCHNEAKTIAAVVARAKEICDVVIVVDDGSTDESAVLAQQAGAQVISHGVNRGKGAAILTGLATAHAQQRTHLITLDGDGQHDPTEIQTFMQHAQAHPDALIIGARNFIDTPNVPGSSKFGRKFSNFWVTRETNCRLSDTQSGFRLYPVDAVLALNIRPSRFQWEVEVIVRALWSGMRVLEVPISVHYLPAEQRVSHYRGFIDSTLITLMHCRLVTLWLGRSLLIKLQDVARQHASAPRLSVAIAAGVAIGSTPFYGFHFAIGLAAGALFGFNQLALLVGEQISNPFVAPLLTYANIRIGHLVRGSTMPLQLPHTISFATLQPFFTDAMIGSLLLGPSIGLVLGTVSYLLIKKIRKPIVAQQAWTGKSKGTGIGYRIFFFLMRVTGIRSAQLLLVFITTYYFLASSKTRQDSYDYLKRVLDPKKLKHFVYRQIAIWRHLFALGNSIIDSVAVRLKPDKVVVDDRLAQTTRPQLSDLYAQGAGLVLLSAHVGGWSALSRRDKSIQINYVMYQNETAAIQRVLDTVQSPISIINSQDGFSASVKILAALRRGEAVALHGDRLVNNNCNPDEWYALPFLGQIAHFPKGPFQVAAISGAPVVIFFSARACNYKFSTHTSEVFRFDGLDRDQRNTAAQQLAQAYVAQLEAFVRRYPYQWFNLYRYW